jgi:3'-phosphoadenosine 5'-phosphosulfate sulfotransferase (PAPS reductase)/FAD synthetase
MKYLCNFSGGASSILATKIALDFFGADNCDIIFCETNSHLPFMKELFLRSQDWYKKKLLF